MCLQLAFSAHPDATLLDVTSLESLAITLGLSDSTESGADLLFPPSPEPTPEEQCEADQHINKVREFLTTIPELLHRVLVAIYWEDLSYRDAALKLGLSLTMLFRLHRTALESARAFFAVTTH